MSDEADQCAARIIGLYERQARHFDRERIRTLFERAWLDKFLSFVPGGGEIVDVGCGMGEPIARYFIESGRRVTGVDSSRSMIEMCRERFADHTWIVSDMRELDVGRTFDGVLAFDSFFHLTADDQRSMFAIFGRLAGDRAPLMFTSGPRAGVAMGTYHGEPLFHASLDPQEYRALLERHGFDEIAFAPEASDCDGRSVWLARKR